MKHTENTLLENEALEDLVEILMKTLLKKRHIQ